MTEPAAHIDVKFKKLSSSVEPSVLTYLRGHGWDLQHAKLAADAKAGKLIKRDGYFWAKDINTYAKTWCKIASTPVDQPNSGKEDLQKYQAKLAELNFLKRSGQLIDAAEEEARDAKLWFAVRTDLENHGPSVINELINRIASIGLPEEITTRILGLVPELRAGYEDAIADIFDRYAKAGGIEA